MLAKTSYQMLGISSFSDRVWALTPSKGNERANFCGEKKSTTKLSGMSILENKRENLKLNVALVFESNALY